MKRLACIHLMLIALPGLAFASDKDVSAILQVHALERRGHLTGS